MLQGRITPQVGHTPQKFTSKLKNGKIKLPTNISPCKIYRAEPLYCQQQYWADLLYLVFKYFR